MRAIVEANSLLGSLVAALGDLGASGCSSVGRARRCQRRCRGFESHHPLVQFEGWWRKYIRSVDVAFIDLGKRQRRDENTMSDETTTGSAAQDEDEEIGGDLAPGGDEGQEGDEKPEKLDLDVKIDTRIACERHITVTIHPDDTQPYFSKAFSELMETAAVPGFRAGRAPRKLVEKRFRKDVKDQVKGSLLMDSLGQISEEHELSPISEPDFNPLAIEVPDEGPMTFEFDIEVRPEFDLPNWKGLKIDRPGREFSEKDVEWQLHDILAKHGRLVPHDGAAEPGDYLTLNLTFKFGDDVISSVKEEVI